MKGEVPAKTLLLTHTSHVSLQESLGGGGVWRGCRVPQQIKTMPMQGHELACKKTAEKKESKTKEATYSSLMKLPTERPPQLMPPIKLPPMKLPARDSRLGRLF